MQAKLDIHLNIEWVLQAANARLWPYVEERVINSNPKAGTSPTSGLVYVILETVTTSKMEIITNTSPTCLMGAHREY